MKEAFPISAGGTEDLREAVQNPVGDTAYLLPLDIVLVRPSPSRADIQPRLNSIFLSLSAIVSQAPLHGEPILPFLLGKS